MSPIILGLTDWIQSTKRAGMIAKIPSNVIVMLKVSGSTMWLASRAISSLSQSAVGDESGSCMFPASAWLLCACIRVPPRLCLGQNEETCWLQIAVMATFPGRPLAGNNPVSYLFVGLRGCLCQRDRPPHASLQPDEQRSADYRR